MVETVIDDPYSIIEHSNIFPYSGSASGYRNPIRVEAVRRIAERNGHIDDRACRERLESIHV